MKQTNKHWLLQAGTREGNRLVFSRPWTPSANTDVAQTFRRVRERLALEQFNAWCEAQVDEEHWHGEFIMLADIDERDRV